ncbi:hypothetical protein [Mycobacteroides abscessus]|uniref:hypothetical protein n=1 Tax=Mycobacteroides abscessus TaxID=36809 RepID=UPI000926C3AE|nr:hypothetical protein [Mycobacteroides abscessus]SHP98502.1 Uncharacterised protein [Mycobacteroides abscessus subsp. abscessus]SHQ61137.1 Uncharacterised protein [Mycobacteroides abscessus subsp. abscessus]SKD63485.1 Uncharacterised protein [Mycobacteroides abscessus subsp. abscessus]SLD63079.1 Uncharacterised protein [Mycobacteroides abscessus subsp. abscessus]
MTYPRDPFEVMSEARDRAIGWATVAFVSWLAGTAVFTMGDTKSAAVVLLASSVGGVTIPALVLAARELSRRSSAKRAISGGIR